MRRGLRWVVIAAGLLVFGVSGISISSQPDYEVLFNPEPPLETCTGALCLATYELEVGNTGWRAQEHVRVRLRDEVLRATAWNPTIRNFGVVDRPVDVHADGGIRTYDLGRVKPRERVELQFVLRYKERGDAPAWEQILVSVDAAQGDARPGDPAAVTLGRVLYAVFGIPW